MVRVRVALIVFLLVTACGAPARPAPTAPSAVAAAPGRAPTAAPAGNVTPPPAPTVAMDPPPLVPLTDAPVFPNTTPWGGPPLEQRYGAERWKDLLGIAVMVTDSAMYQTTSTPEDVRAWYHEEMPAAGWTLDGEWTSTDGYPMAAWRKGTRLVILLTADAPGQVTAIALLGVSDAPPELPQPATQKRTAIPVSPGVTATPAAAAGVPLGPDSASRLAELGRWPYALLPGQPWSSDGGALAAASGRRVVALAVPGATAIGYTRTENDPVAIAWAPGGGPVAIAGDQLVRVWVPATGEVTYLGGPDPEAMQSMEYMAYNADGTHLMGVGIYRADWDIAERSMGGVALENPVHGVAYTPAGETFMWGRGAMLLGNPYDPAARRLPVAEGYDVRAAALSPDGALVAAEEAGGIGLWDLGALSKRGLLPMELSAKTAVAFSPDGRLVAAVTGATSGQDGFLRVWNVADGEELVTLEGFVGTLAFSPDGLYLAAGVAGDASLLALLGVR